MIDCGYFYDAEHDAWNIRVLDRPEVNATADTEQSAQDILLESWNRQTPGEPATPEQFTYQEVDPW